MAFLQVANVSIFFDPALDSYLTSCLIFALVNIPGAMEKTKYKIGEFSKLARVTVRTLRHYEDIGLLKPDIVDRWTGYRYYSPGQLQKLRVWLQDSIKQRLQHRGIRKFSVCPRPLDGHPEAEKIKS